MITNHRPEARVLHPKDVINVAQRKHFIEIVLFYSVSSVPVPGAETDVTSEKLEKISPLEL